MGSVHVQLPHEVSMWNNFYCLELSQTFVFRNLPSVQQVPCRGAVRSRVLSSADLLWLCAGCTRRSFYMETSNNDMLNLCRCGEHLRFDCK